MADDKNKSAGATAKPVIFISYSHKDEPDHPGPDDIAWLTFVQSFLAPVIKVGIFDIWVDQHPHGGDALDPEIKTKLAACDIFVLLTSRFSLASTYVVETEVATMRQRQKNGEDVHIYPIVLSPVPNAALKRLKDLVLKPKDGKPLSLMSKNEREVAMAGIADDIAAVAQKIAEKKRAAASEKLAGVIPSLTTMVESMVESGVWIVGHSIGSGYVAKILKTFVDTTHLPETAYERLVGRDAELKRLDDAWADNKTNIISLIAEGGAGKSALVNEWLKRMQADNYRGAAAVLGWSFYSQGTKERAASAESFLNWALEKLGIKLGTTSATAKGEAIAEALMRRRMLLVLDGVEPLQHGLDAQQGELKDQALRALLRRFASAPPTQAHSLIVLTSRLPVKDIARWQEGVAPIENVERLSDEAGAALLRDHGLWASDGGATAASRGIGRRRLAPGFLANSHNWQEGVASVEYVERLSDAAGAALVRDNGVWGTDKELQATAHEFGGHPLALGLLASFLNETQKGDVRRRDHIRDLLHDEENPRHDHAKRVMESYEKEWLKNKPVLLAILQLVGLFDRPASGDCLNALRRKPAIVGLTDQLVDLDDSEWQRAIARLREVRLLTPIDPSIPDALDAHPLVREWFGERLKEKNEKAWREAHGRLYEHLRDSTKEGKTPTLDDLAPLYQAIAHGCSGGRHQEALDEIYKSRICRRKADGQLEFYAGQSLGARSSNLAATSWFFEKPFEVPVTNVAATDQSWLLSQAAFNLQAQGRFIEALPAHRASLRITEAPDNWLTAQRESNLSIAELFVGDVDAAVASAANSVVHADSSGDQFFMIVFRTAYANALHAAGRRTEAETIFLDAERRQQVWDPHHPLLGSVQGYRYCDFLLAKKEWAKVRDQAGQTLKWFGEKYPNLSLALDNLTLARANLGLMLTKIGANGSTNFAIDDAHFAVVHPDIAIGHLRSARTLDYLPVGFLARAAFRRSIGDWKNAKVDLDEVEEIAEPGPMRLHLCDMALERARLAFAQAEAFAPLNGVLKDDNPPKPKLLDAAEIARLKDEAAKQLAIAADYIATCGYHRRDEELAELQAVRDGKRKFADLPPRV